MLAALLEVDKDNMMQRIADAEEAIGRRLKVDEKLSAGEAQAIYDAIIRLRLQLLEHRRLTLDDNENDPFAWTPDGKAVLFNSDRNGTSAIFRQVTDQPLAERLTTGVEQLKQPE